jgi:hypothetical protein
MPAMDRHVRSEDRVALAERILAELGQQTERALDALGRDDPDAMLEAVSNRGRAIAELDRAVTYLMSGREAYDGAVTEEMVNRVAEMAERTLRAHHDLLRRVSGEHERIEEELETTERGATATQAYGSRVTRAGRNLSLTG